MLISPVLSYWYESENLIAIKTRHLFLVYSKWN